MSERQRRGPAPSPADTAASGSAATDGLDFDGRLARLEAIVGELEAGGLGLESALERYREGIGLLGRCREVLAGFRSQVEELSREAEQGLVPFEGDPDIAGGNR